MRDLTRPRVRPSKLAGVALLARSNVRRLRRCCAQQPQEDEGEDEEQPLPPGHPSTGGQAKAQVFQPPPDTNVEDSAPRPLGTIPPYHDPQPGERPARRDPGVTLGIVFNSVAKGESREHKLGTSDSNGVALSFTGLATGSGIAYRGIGREGGCHVLGRRRSRYRKTRGCTCSFTCTR